MAAGQSGMSGSGRDEGGRVVPLGKDPLPPPPVVESRPGRLQGLAIFGLAVSVIAGVCAVLFLVAVSMTDSGTRFVKVVLAACVVIAVACAAIAVFSAARDTYAPPGNRRRDD